MALDVMTAQEAARLIKDTDNVAFSGFTPTGSPKVVPMALAEYAKLEHESNRPFKIGVYASGSVGDAIDGNLARANAVNYRIPYQSNADMRNAINKGELEYCDIHLSHLAQALRTGCYGEIDVLIVEACDVTESGEIVPTCGVGILPTLCKMAKRKIIVELNTWHPKELRGLHDLLEFEDPPFTKPVNIYNVLDRVGRESIQVDPSKIVVVHTHVPNDEVRFAPLDDITNEIGLHISDFLLKEMDKGRIPKDFLPLQSGVGNISNALIDAMGKNKGIPDFHLYTEILQDRMIRLISEGRIKSASTCGLSISNEMTQKVYENLDFFKERIVLRPVEFTNHPSIVRRLGVITINTALEADISGNVNSSHVAGSKIQNGIGGSADFARNGYISIFVTPSTAKNEQISCFVPMVTHADHSEHSIDILVSEYGVADMRGKSPRQRAELIINNCAHPTYRPILREYLATCHEGHVPMNLKNVFALHNAYLDTGDMRNVEFV